jgi:hypothetical protein
MFHCYGRRLFMVWCRFAPWIALASVMGSIAPSAAAAPRPKKPSAEEADPKYAQVEGLIAEANRLRNIGDDQGAMPLVQKAYEIAPGPRTVVQLGMVESALGRWADADKHLTEGLKTPGHFWIQRNLPAIIERLRMGKEKIGKVEVKGEPAGASVIVNGSEVGTLPMATPVTVNIGSTDVEVRAAGHEPQSRNLTVTAQTVHTVVVRLKPAAGPPLVRAPPPSSAGPPTLPGALSETAADTQTRAGSGWRWLRLGTIVAAGGAAAVAGYTYALRERKVTEFREKTDAMRRGRCYEKGGTVVDADNRPAMRDCFDLRSEYRSAQTIMVGSLIATGVLAAGAVALWTFGPEGDQEQARVRRDQGAFAFAVEPGGAWAAYQILF